MSGLAPACSPHSSAQHQALLCDSCHRLGPSCSGFSRLGRSRWSSWCHLPGLLPNFHLLVSPILLLVQTLRAQGQLFRNCVGPGKHTCGFGVVVVTSHPQAAGAVLPVVSWPLLTLLMVMTGTGPTTWPGVCGRARALRPGGSPSSPAAKSHCVLVAPRGSPRPDLPDQKPWAAGRCGAAWPGVGSCWPCWPPDNYSVSKHVRNHSCLILD